MRDVLLIFLILISLSIIALVLSQQKSGGLGSAFGGGGGGGGGGGEAYRSKRGVEKLFHYLTILLAVLFSTVSLSLIFIN